MQCHNNAKSGTLHVVARRDARDLPHTVGINNTQSNIYDGNLPIWCDIITPVPFNK